MNCVIISTFVDFFWGGGTTTFIQQLKKKPLRLQNLVPMYAFNFWKLTQNHDYRSTGCYTNQALDLNLACSARVCRRETQVAVHGAARASCMRLARYSILLFINAL